MNIDNKKIIKLRKVLHAKYGNQTFCLQYNEQNKSYVKMEPETNAFFLEENVLITSRDNYFYLLPNDSNHYYQLIKVDDKKLEFKFKKVEVEDDSYTKTDLNEECIENVVNLDFPCYFRRANTQSKDTLLSILLDKKKLFLDTHVPSYEIIKVLSLYCLAKRDFSKILEYLKYFIEQESEDTYSFRTKFFLSIENMCYLRYKENDKEKWNDLKNIINSVYLAHTLQFGQENIMDNLCLFFFYYTINSDIIIGENYNLKISLDMEEKEYIFQIHQSKIVILGNRNKKNKRRYEVYNQSIKEERFRQDILRKLKNLNLKKEEVPLKTLRKVGKDIGYEEEYINKYFKKFGDNFYSEYMKYQFIDDKTKVSSIQQKKKDTEKKHNTNKTKTEKSYFNIDKTYPFNKIKDEFKNKYKLKEINWDILEEIYETDREIPILTKYNFPVFDNFEEIQSSNIFKDLDSLIIMIYLDFLYPGENRHNMLIQKTYITDNRTKKFIKEILNNEWKREITKQIGLLFPELLAYIYIHKISIKNLNVLVGNYNYLKKLDRIRDSFDNDKFFCIIEYIKSGNFSNIKINNEKYFEFKEEVKKFGACLLEKYMDNTIGKMNFPQKISNEEIQRYVAQFIELNDYYLYNENKTQQQQKQRKKKVKNSQQTFESVFDPKNIHYLSKITLENKDEIELNTGLYVLYLYHKRRDPDVVLTYNRIYHLAFRLDYIDENSQNEKPNFICFENKEEKEQENIIILPKFTDMKLREFNLLHLELILQLQRKDFDLKVIRRLLNLLYRGYISFRERFKKEKIYSISYNNPFNNLKTIYDELLLNLQIYSFKDFLLKEHKDHNEDINYRRKFRKKNRLKREGIKNKIENYEIFSDFRKMKTNVGDNVPDYVTSLVNLYEKQKEEQKQRKKKQEQEEELEPKKITEYPELEIYIKNTIKNKDTMNERIQYLLNLDGYISFPYYKFYSSFYKIVESNLSLIRQNSVKIPIKYTNVFNSIENFNLYKIEIDKLPEAGDLLSLKFPCNKFIEKYNEISKKNNSMANIYLLFEISKFIDMYEKKEYPGRLYLNSSNNVNIVESNLHRPISTLQVPKFYNNLLDMAMKRNASESKQKKSSTPKNKTTGKRKLPSSGPPKPPNTKKQIKVIDLT